jgi:hypothetical protein
MAEHALPQRFLGAGYGHRAINIQSLDLIYRISTLGPLCTARTTHTLSCGLHEFQFPLLFQKLGLLAWGVLIAMMSLLSGTILRERTRRGSIEDYR